MNYFDMSQPITMPVIIGSVIVIMGMVGVGLLVVEYYKKKLGIKKKEK